MSQRGGDKPPHVYKINHSLNFLLLFRGSGWYRMEAKNGEEKVKKMLWLGYWKISRRASNYKDLRHIAPY